MKNLRLYCGIWVNLKSRTALHRSSSADSHSTQVQISWHAEFSTRSEPISSIHLWSWLHLQQPHGIREWHVLLRDTHASSMTHFSSPKTTRSLANISKHVLLYTITMPDRIHRRSNYFVVFLVVGYATSPGSTNRLRYRDTFNVAFTLYWRVRLD
jgi:hypothetical protein